MTLNTFLVNPSLNSLIEKYKDQFDEFRKLNNINLALNPKFLKISFIPFNQSSDVVIHVQKEPKKYETLSNVNKKFGGLCDVICNDILIRDLLGRGKDGKFLKTEVNIESVNQKKVRNSHLSKIYSLFRKIIAFLFGVYPDNIFSCRKQWKLVQKRSVGHEKVSTVNRQILREGFQTIANGTTLKLEVFKRTCCGMPGHSLLIKKTENDQYIFFDPNSGEERNLSLAQLSDRIDNQLKLHKGTDIFLTKGDDYLKRMKL